MSAARVNENLRFDGRAAVVTGAGRGMGRAHALMLAERGAEVVVNDLGGDVWGSEESGSAAAEVVQEIQAAGGSAIASHADVGTPEGGQAIIDTAIEAFGRLDVLVHNAGIKQDSEFATTDLRDLRRVVDVNLLSAWFLGQPAWREMSKQGYGRIVFASSASVFGLANVGAYAATKAGLIALTRSLDAEARAEGLDVHVNAVLPMAATRMSSEGQRELWNGLNDPSEVSPVVVYMVSERCELSGCSMLAGGTHVAEVRLAQSPGWARKRPGLTPEDVADHLAEIVAFEAPVYPTSTVGYMEDTYERVLGKTIAMAVTRGAAAD